MKTNKNGELVRGVATSDFTASTAATLHGQSFVSSTVSHATGSLPESKHLDGSNYNEWKFWMKNFLIDAGLWHCIEPREGQIIDRILTREHLPRLISV